MIAISGQPVWLFWRISLPTPEPRFTPLRGGPLVTQRLRQTVKLTLEIVHGAAHRFPGFTPRTTRRASLLSAFALFGGGLRLSGALSVRCRGSATGFISRPYLRRLAAGLIWWTSVTGCAKTNDGYTGNLKVGRDLRLDSVGAFSAWIAL